MKKRALYKDYAKQAADDWSRTLDLGVRKTNTRKNKLNLDIRRKLRSGKFTYSDLPTYSDAFWRLKVAEGWHQKIVSARPGQWNLWARLTLTAEQMNRGLENRFYSDDCIIGNFISRFSRDIDCDLRYSGTFDQQPGNLHFHLLIQLKQCQSDRQIESAAWQFNHMPMPGLREDRLAQPIPLHSREYKYYAEYLTGAGEVFEGKALRRGNPLHFFVQKKAAA